MNTYPALPYNTYPTLAFNTYPIPTLTYPTLPFNDYPDLPFDTYPYLLYPLIPTLYPYLPTYIQWVVGPMGRSPEQRAVGPRMLQ